MYTAWSVVFGETPSASKWNLLGSNDASFNDGSGIGAVIGNAHLLPTAGDLGGAWLPFTPNPTGFSGTPTVAVARYMKIGKSVIMDISITGTSNSGSFGFTLPIAPKSAPRFYPRVTDNGTIQTTEGIIVLTAGSTTASIGKNLQNVGFTASGVKAAEFFGAVYEIE